MSATFIGEGTNGPAVVGGATRGAIVVVASVTSQARYGTQSHGESIGGCTDSQGNTYSTDAAFDAELPYYINSTTDGWKYGRIRVFSAAGTLVAGDTVTVSYSLDSGGSGSPLELLVFDCDPLGGGASTAATVFSYTAPPGPGGLRDITDADALGLTFNATTDSYGALTASYPNLDIAAWVEGYSSGLYGVVTSSGWGNAGGGRLRVGYPLGGPTPTEFHLSVQVRPYGVDETP
jgi:hypothetical protein